VNGIDVASLEHSEIVDLLKVRGSGINIVAERCAASHHVVSAQKMKSGETDSSTLSPVNVKPNARLHGALDTELRDRADGEMTGECAVLPEIPRMSNVCSSGAERTKTCKQISPAASSLSSSALSSVPTFSRNHHDARKTVSSVSGVTMTTPCIATTTPITAITEPSVTAKMPGVTVSVPNAGDKQLARTVCSREVDRCTKAATELHPVEV